MKREKKKRNKTKNSQHPKTVGQYQKCNICVTEMPEGEGRNGEEIFEVKMYENFPKLMTNKKT